MLSGSDWGNLLLWEGNLIKCEIKHANGGNCHAGPVRSVMIHGSQIITGGNDGYVRSWPLAEIQEAEITDDMPIFKVDNLKEVCLLDMEAGRDIAKVQTMLKGDDHWLVQDSSGGVYKVNLETGECKSLFNFHSGAISGADLCPFNHAAATCGADGSVRMWDYIAKSPICTFRSPAAATCLTWAARAVDPEGRTICVGYADGVLRILARCKDGLQLKSALKPHPVALSALAYSPDGAHLATGAADGSVFFLSVNRGAYSPVGFMNFPPKKGAADNATPPAVTTLVWAAEDALCVGYADGTVAQLNLPTEVDTSETFELAFDGIVYNEMPIVEARRNAIKMARALEKSKQAAPPAAAEDGLEAAPAAEEVEEPIEDLDAGAVRAILPLKGAPDAGLSFYVTFANEAGLMWQVTFGSTAASTIERHAAPIVYLRLSRSGSMLLSGAADGSVCVGELGSDAYWMGRMNGASPSVMPTLSFDDAYLVSAGGDGNIFVHKMATHDPKDPILSAIGLPSLAESGPNSADIVDKATYSIEEAKQKEESDARAAQAQEKKLTVKEKVELLRKKFANLLAENTALPTAERLPRESFYVDPGLKEATEAETLARLEEARAELAWTSEKSALSRSKLEAHYLQGLAVESIALYGFANDKVVRSFRLVELVAWQKEAMEHVHALIDKEAKSRARATRTSRGDGDGDKGADGDGEEDVLGQSADAGASGNEKISKMQERLLRRQKRAKEWAEFNATRPDDKYEDPADVAAILHAETHMGDFSLKTDTDYVVPESQRVNAQKKRRQIVLLDESIHAIKVGFNDRFLALRDLKQRIIGSLKEEDARLEQINAELSLFEVLEPSLISPGALVPAEQPELRREVNDEQLEAFRKEEEAAKAKAKGGGFGGGGGGGSVNKGGGAAASSAAAGRSGGAAAGRGGVSSEGGASSLEETERELHRARLMVEKERLIERRRATIRSFDEALAELRVEKLRLEADLKTTDLRKLVLFQELALLKEFEKKDTTLSKRLESKHNEKAEIVVRVAECQEKLTQKKVEIERLLDRDRQIMAEFHSALGDGNKFYDALLKIFKRKIKRKKQQQDGDDDEDDEDDDDISDDDDDDLDEEEEEEETCPAGCDPALYEKVCELRERRLEQEEVYAEFQKGVEALKKENEMLIKKEKTIDKALKDTEVDIQTFQTEKQGKLNELHVVVTLHMSQVRHVIDGKLPSDLTEDLVFPASKLDGLRNRIRQLGQEKSDLRKRQKALRTEHVTLHREQAVKQEKLRELDARLRDVQMLKFGQVIDLERIESVGVNKVAEELEARIVTVERSQQAALAAWQDKLKKAKTELKDATDQSTTSLNTVAALFERQHALETSLNSKQAAVAPKEAGVERKERTSLVQLVKIQAKEVEALKLEINMLRRKGGHIYTGAK